ncbi:NAD-P-binding protein [Rhodofomes roseus]|uniref:NAD-P-binding protein n=1 Tax=Rhodofomes roseus TaxID=34475 RepID=A0ABQ8KJP6_9APHY|nr:NAD-P-binding protein [Rhodofomes roseus]KAH9838030.1 NAD-P-binding protein [Rhodofomes roseus]
MSSPPYGARTARLRVIMLDVTDSEENIGKVVDEAWAVWGRIDVLVNNAGRGSNAVLEEGGADLMRAVFETNVFGAVKVTNTILPHCCRRKSGLIIFLGSRSSGRPIFPYIDSSYLATKAAIHAISESLAVEVAQFGIHVLLAIPGGSRTSQLNTPYTMNHHFADYDGYREDSLREMHEHWNHAQGDPAKAMDVLVDVGMPLPSWLLLGRPTFLYAKKQSERLLENISIWEGISRDLDFDITVE